MKFDKAAFRGIIPAAFLPMAGNEDIDWDTLRSYTDWLVGCGPCAVAFNMEASEVAALDADEQLRVTAAVAERVAGQIPVVSGLVAGSTRGARAFAREHVAAGADALVVFPPLPTFLGQPLSVDMVYAYHSEIADAVPETPLIAFQMPRSYGAYYGADALKRLSSIPTLVGMKEASFDPASFGEALTATRSEPDPIVLLTGSDTAILEYLVLGAEGALIGFAAIATDLNVAMWQASRDGDYVKAREIWDRLRPLATLCWGAPIRDMRPRMKEALVLAGIFAEATVRAPQLAVSAEEVKAIRHAMEQGDLLPR
ncbi:MAG: dihydrodipicolinate synthase family protein [Mycobacterium sp.]